MGTLHGTNISHLGKRKIFKMPFLRDMLVSWRVIWWPLQIHKVLITGNFPAAGLPPTLGPAAKAATMAASAAAATAASAASSWRWREIRGKGGESWLVGGWTNQSEKYDRQNGNLPQIGVKIKHIWNHHRDEIFTYTSYTVSVFWWRSSSSTNLHQIRLSWLIIM